jgi:hypothetical protein
MLANLLRQLVGRTEPAADAGGHMMAVRVEFEPLRMRVHALLREGNVADALGELVPALSASVALGEIRALAEFSIRTAAGLARKDAWRREIAYMLGAILLAIGDEEGALLCARVSWPAAGALDGLRKFTRGPDIVEYCRAAGLPASTYPELMLERMDGFVSADPEPVPASLCMLPGGMVLGQSFLPATREGVVFSQRCTDSPAKLGRFDGVEQLDMLRLAAEMHLWAAGGGTRRYAGPHVLIGNHDNIGHWLLFYFARTRLLEEAPELGSAKIVVGENLRPLHAECLARAGIPAERLLRLPAGEFAEFEELWVPSLICGVSATRVMYWTPETIHYVRRILGVVPGRARGKRRVYISRRGARWRRMLNEDEISGVLAEFGFEEIDPGTLNLQQQIDLAAETEAMVGCFGAGMNFHLFAGEGVPVVQIQAEKRPRMNIHVQITKVLGQPFFAAVGEVPRPHSDPLKSDFLVSPEEVKKVVSQALNR